MSDQARPPTRAELIRRVAELEESVLARAAAVETLSSVRDILGAAAAESIEEAATRVAAAAYGFRQTGAVESALKVLVDAGFVVDGHTIRPSSARAAEARALSASASGAHRLVLPDAPAGGRPASVAIGEMQPGGTSGAPRTTDTLSPETPAGGVAQVDVGMGVAASVVSLSDPDDESDAPFDRPATVGRVPLRRLTRGAGADASAPAVARAIAVSLHAQERWWIHYPDAQDPVAEIRAAWATGHVVSPDLVAQLAARGRARGGSDYRIPLDCRGCIVWSAEANAIVTYLRFATPQVEMVKRWYGGG